jgi:Fe2+ transport system protein B
VFVFAFVVMIYIQSLATIAVLVKEYGVKTTAMISIVEVLRAVVLGGVLFRILLFLGFG